MKYNKFKFALLLLISLYLQSNHGFNNCLKYFKISLYCVRFTLYWYTNYTINIINQLVFYVLIDQKIKYLSK
jgi:hypothetical protein